MASEGKGWPVAGSIVSIMRSVRNREGYGRGIIKERWEVGIFVEEGWLPIEDSAETEWFPIHPIQITPIIPTESA